MQIRKTYSEINPELLYAEVRDFVLKQGVSLDEHKLETYTQPDESASFVSRGTLTFRARGAGSKGEECLRAHVVGTARGDTKLMLDIDDGLFPKTKVTALLEDLDFIFGDQELE